MPEIEIPKKRQPEKTFKAGGMTAAVWRNKSGEQVRYSVTLEKRMLKGESWKSIKSMNINDIPKAMVALQKAFEYLVLKKPNKEIVEEEAEQ